MAALTSSSPPTTKSFYSLSGPSPYGSASSLKSRDQYDYFSYTDKNKRSRTEETVRKQMAPYINFLINPHKDLVAPELKGQLDVPQDGRTVCPVTPSALRDGTLFFAVDPTTELTPEMVEQKLRTIKDDFLTRLKPEEGTKQAIRKGAIIAFPKLSQKQIREILEPVQLKLEKEFVKDGLFSIELDPENPITGTFNDKLKTGQTPVPVIFVRHLLDTDVRVLNRNVYSPEDRVNIFTSFLEKGFKHTRNIERAKAALTRAQKEVQAKQKNTSVIGTVINWLRKK